MASSLLVLKCDRYFDLKLL